MPAELYKQIREERIKKGISQKELGEMVGLPQQAINRIEQGQRKLDVELFEKLCKALKIEKIGSFSVGLISNYYQTDVNNDESPIEEFEPTYEDVERLVARNGKKMSTEQKMKLIKLLSEI